MTLLLSTLLTSLAIASILALCAWPLLWLSRRVRPAIRRDDAKMRRGLANAAWVSSLGHDKINVRNILTK